MLAFQTDSWLCKVRIFLWCRFYHMYLCYKEWVRYFNISILFSYLHLWNLLHFLLKTKFLNIIFEICCVHLSRARIILDYGSSSMLEVKYSLWFSNIQCWNQRARVVNRLINLKIFNNLLQCNTSGKKCQKL